MSLGPWTSDSLGLPQTPMAAVLLFSFSNFAFSAAALLKRKLSLGRIFSHKLQSQM